MTDINIARMLPAIALLPPDARWRLLQSWLDDNPEINARLNSWLDMSPDEVFPELREIVARMAEREWGVLGGALARTAALTPDTWNWIATVQSCYRDRKAFDAEGKNHGGRNKA